MIPSEWIDQAARRLSGLILQTPLTTDPTLNITLKWENRQTTGSFKIRGALNKILALERWEQERGLVTASAGNHGQGVALGGRQVGAPVTVLVPQHTPAVKLEALRALGADLRIVEGTYGDAERAAIAFANQTNATWISPYNDAQVIAGQATLGMELLEELASQPPAAIIVPVGGGGLAAGTAAAIDRVEPRPLLIGVQAETSPYFYEIYHHGTQENVVEQPSLADGLAGAVEEGSITIPLVRRCMDAMLLVSEEQIERAIAYAWTRHNEIVEGAGAAALAAVLSGAVRGPLLGAGEARSGPVAVVISGGNIQPDVHQRICARWSNIYHEGEAG